MIKIGFWRKSRNEVSELPWPTDYYDPHWDDEEREVIAAYLDGGKTDASYKGWSECRVCGCMNGSCDMTDGIYLWPEGLAHYVREHNIRLPREFMDHALKSANASDVAQRARQKKAQDNEHLEDIARRINAVGQETDDRLQEYQQTPYGEIEMRTVPIETSNVVSPAWGSAAIATENERERKMATQALESKIAYLNRVFEKKGGLIPEWDSLTFDQKADKIRELMRKRRGYSKYDKRDIT